MKIGRFLGTKVWLTPAVKVKEFNIGLVYFLAEVMKMYGVFD